jgi:hypothetical protein
MGTKGKRMGVWIHTLGSIPYLSSLASDNPSGAALHARTARLSYPGADKGGRVPPISQHWTAKWRCCIAEMKCPAHPICAVSHRFRNRGHDRLGSCDFHCVVSRRFGDRGHDCLGPCDISYVVIAHGELQRVTVPPGTPNITTSRMNRGPPRICRAAPPLQNPNV